LDIEGNGVVTGGKQLGRAALGAALAFLISTVGHAQQVANIGFESVGRAAPLVSSIPREYPVTDLARLEVYPENDLVVGPWRPMRPGPNGGEPVQRNEGSAWNGASPPGIEPLPVDLFTSKNFYADKARRSAGDPPPG
jgi:hypothetical protein